MGSNPTSPRPRLRSVASYLQKYATQTYPSIVTLGEDAPRKISRGLETLLFDLEAIDDFSNTVANLKKEHAPGGDLSHTAIEGALVEALFAATFASPGSWESAEFWSGDPLTALRSLIQLPSQSYECWLEVMGLWAPSLPFQFGNTVFQQLEGTQRDKGRLTFHNLNSSLPRPALNSIRDGLGESAIGKTIAIQAATAKEPSAALELAEQQVHATVDCMNFFIDVIQPGQGRLALPREQGSLGTSFRLAANIATGASSHVTESHAGGAFSMDVIRKPGSIVADAAQVVESLLVQDHLTDVELLLFNAVRWAGKAASAASPQDTFLFSAIALECLALPSGNDELTFRLSHRLARLLHSEASGRLESARKIRQLYGVRSKIVHSGDFTGSQDDQYEMRRLLMLSILEMLTNQDVRAVKSRQNLEDFFEQLTLA